MRCPTCKGAVAPPAANVAFPFCNARCKLVDLGKWLTEAYRVPGEPAGDAPPEPEADEPAPAPASSAKRRSS